MKVLVLIDAWFPFVGGAQIQVKNLKKILNKQYQINYFILHSPSSSLLVRFLWSFWVIPQVFFLHLRYKFDLIHSHAYWPGIPGKILSKILGIPLIFTVHGSNLLDLKIKSPKAWLEKIILTQIKYDQMISVSSNFLRYQNVNKNITTIPNGVDIIKFKMQNKKCKITNKNSKIKMLFVGRNDPVKGLRYLKQAMIRVNQKIPEAELKIIQKRYSRQKLIKEYLKADIFVLPSLSEGQPLTLLEAWAAKLPVVVTAVGDNPQMVKNGINGYLAKPGDINDLAEKIIKVLRDKKRRQLGVNGYSLVKRQYTWPKCAFKTYQVYKKALLTK